MSFQQINNDYDVIYFSSFLEKNPQEHKGQWI
jgi:hypothetical protein